MGSYHAFLLNIGFWLVVIWLGIETLKYIERKWPPDAS